MKFSIQPPPGQSAFDQWRDAMKAVCRLPMGMPPEFRKKVWLSLADHYLCQLKINWEKTVRFAFNERSNPDDEQLGMQIVKDLHRTGCSNFSGDDNDEDRAVLKRLLLAYARWNKRVGYCQGFNVIAALLLNVMDRKEDDALKVMIYLIDSVLPESYFANNLRALSVDMAVFRDLLRLTYPKLSKHLDRLQLAAQDVRTGACYEPPLTNVFTMQWFLTLFATCLPVNIVLRVWDSILLEGSEVLLRTALTIWGKLAKRIMGASSADEFYSLMGELSSSMMQGSVFDGDTMVKSIYSLGDFPLPHLNELREKYTYNIRPFSQPSGSSKKNSGRSVFKSLLNSDEDELDDDDIAAMACMPGDISSSSDISVLGPGVYGSGMDDGTAKSAPEMERMSTDIQSLKLQYEKLKQRQRQAHIIIAAASAKKSRPSAQGRLGAPGAPAAALVPSIESPTAMNHLFLGKASTSTRNRVVTDGPRISAPTPTHRNSGLMTKQLQAVANAQAVSKSKRMRTGISSKGGGTSPAAVRATSPATTMTETSCSSEGSPSPSPSPSQQEGSSASSPPPEDASDLSPADSPVKEASRIASSSQEGDDLSSKNVCDADLVAHSAVSSSSEQLSHTNTDSLASSDVSESALGEGTSKSGTESSTETLLCIDDSAEMKTQHSTYSADNDMIRISELSLTEGNENSLKDSSSMDISSCNTELTSRQITKSVDGGQNTVCLNVKFKDCGTPEHENVKIPAITDNDTSGKLGLLSSSQSLLEDSGVDSPSANSPFITPGGKICCEGSKTASNIDVSSLEEELVLLIEEEQAISGGAASYSISQTAEKDNSGHKCDSEADIVGSSSLQKDVLEENKANMFLESDLPSDSSVNGKSSESDKSTSEKMVPEDSTDSDHRGSVDSSDSTIEVSNLLDAVAMSSPLCEGFSRSSSLIETVPVPGTVDVRADSDEAVNIPIMNTKRVRKTSEVHKDGEVHQEERTHEKLKSSRSYEHSTKKSAHHATTGSHKHSNHSKRIRRFSSPARSDETSSSSQMAGFPSVVKKTSRPFNPFPVRHFNANRAKTGLKLGLYSESTLEQLRGLKQRTTSS